MTKFFFFLYLLSSVVYANVLEVRGIFTIPQEEFIWTLEYDANAIDSNSDDLSEGDYYTWLGRITLDWGENHIETSGASVYVYHNHEGISGFSAYNEHGFTWNGMEFGEKAMYLGAFSPFIHQYFPSDSLSLVESTVGEVFWDSLAVTPYFELNSLDGFHRETDQPEPTFSVSIPEPSISLLFIFGILQIRFRCLKKT